MVMESDAMPVADALLICPALYLIFFKTIIIFRFFFFLLIQRIVFFDSSAVRLDTTKSIECVTETARQPWKQVWEIRAKIIITLIFNYTEILITEHED